MQIVIMVVSTILILCALVVAHEFGHYIAAKKRGIRVSEFAIGFGPRLIKWHRNGTEFSIRPFLIGGFNKFPDDMEDSVPKEGDFRSASLKSRFLTIVAGPLMNIILAVVVTAILLMTVGDHQPVVQTVTLGSTAYGAGIQEGDVIKKMNGVNIDFYYDMQDVAGAGKGDSLKITVERGGEQVSYDIPYMPGEEKVTGINYLFEPVQFNFFEAIGLSFKWLFLQMREILKALGGVFFMGQTQNVGGIVMTAAVVGQAVQSGIATVMQLVALISVNLAIVNLLPIPALDGGKLVMYAVEGIRKKPAPEKLEGALNLIGFMLLIGLSVFLVFQDVGRLMTG